MAWDTLKAIVDDQRKEMRQEAQRPPDSCPYDGALLDIFENVRNCPMGDYRWPSRASSRRGS